MGCPFWASPNSEAGARCRGSEHSSTQPLGAPRAPNVPPGAPPVPAGLGAAQAEVDAVQALVCAGAITALVPTLRMAHTLKKQAFPFTHRETFSQTQSPRDPAWGQEQPPRDSGGPAGLDSQTTDLGVQPCGNLDTGAGPWSGCRCQRSGTSPGQPQTGEQPGWVGTQISDEKDAETKGQAGTGEAGTSQQVWFPSWGPSTVIWVLRASGRRTHSDARPGTKKERWGRNGTDFHVLGTTGGLGGGPASHRAGPSLLLWASPLCPSAAGPWTLLECPRPPQFNSKVGGV